VTRAKPAEVVSPEHMAAMLLRVRDGTISGKTAKDVLWIMAFIRQQLDEDDLPPNLVDMIIGNFDFQQINNPDEILGLVWNVLLKNPEQVRQYLDGKERVYGFFVGQAMKLSGGRANPKMLNEILLEQLAAEGLNQWLRD